MSRPTSGDIARSIADLDRELAAGDLSPEDHAKLVAHYERLASGAATTAVARRRTPPWVWLLTAVVALGAGVGVARVAGERAPGATLTGATGDTAELLAEARAQFRTNPAEAERKLTAVLDAQPDNAEARTYRAWLSRIEATKNADTAAATAAFQAADAELQKAAAIAPTLADPHCFRAVLRFRDLNDPVTSQQELRACRSLNPSQEVVALVTNVRTDVEAALAASQDPLTAALAKARQVRDTDLRGALTHYEAALAVDPANAEARTWQAFLVARIAQDAAARKLLPDDQVTPLVNKSIATLDAVLAAAPYTDASCAKVLVLASRGDKAGASAGADGCKAGIATPELRDLALKSLA